LINIVNKSQGRQISRVVKNKSRKVVNVGSPIHIEDDEIKEVLAYSSQEKYLSPIKGKSMDEKPNVDSSREASFWKKKYFEVVPILQNNLIDLELENQLLRFENKALVENNKRQLSSSKYNKK